RRTRPDDPIDADLVTDLVAALLGSPEALADSPLAPIVDLVRRGRIFFNKTEDLGGLWQASKQPRLTGPALALARTAEAETIAARWGAESQLSPFENWRIVVRPTEKGATPRVALA